MSQNAANVVYIDIDKVCEIVGLRPWAVYNNIKKNGFPKPHKLNKRVSRWDEAAVRAWVASK